jgi:hypothetical protein
MDIKHLLLAAAVLVPPSMAHASNTLKSPAFQGNWCYDFQDESSKHGDYVYIPCTNSNHEEHGSESWYSFGTKQLDGHELGCRYLSVKEWTSRVINDRTVSSAEITAKCEGEACRDTSCISVHVLTDKNGWRALFIHRWNHYNAKCEE